MQFEARTRVRATRKPEHDAKFTRDGVLSRRECDGEEGAVVLTTTQGTVIVAYGATNQACWLPDELTRLDGTTTAKDGHTDREIDALRAEVRRLTRREADIIEACERVADGGQYRADIVSAIQRIRRERDAARTAMADAAKVLLDGFPPNFARAEPWSREEMGAALSRMVKAMERAVAMLDEKRAT